MSDLMISVSGIRGIVGSGLTPLVASRYAGYFAAWLKEGPIVLGRDSRPTGPALHHAVTAALMAMGREVHELGIVPTPTVQLQVEQRHAAGGLAITASHNPIEWNALKLIGPSGRFLTGEEGKSYLALAGGDGPAFHDYAGQGRVVPVDDPLRLHLDLILDLEVVDVPRIREKGFRVALDAVHGAGGAMGRRLLEALGCSVDILFEEPTGLFPRPPEPLAENLEALSKHVSGGGYDIGFAFDPDVDRLSLVDETGRALGEEYTLALAAEAVLERRKGSIVTNLSTSAMVETVAARHGYAVARTAVGEANVVEEIVRSNAVVGGEGNGGVILPELHLGRDAPVGVALILSLMARSGRKLSELAGWLPSLAMVKSKMTIADEMDMVAIEKALADVLPGATLDTRDGIRLSADATWLHVRRSGTEPIVRIIAEAPDRKQALDLVEAATQALSRRN